MTPPAGSGGLFVPHVHQGFCNVGEASHLVVFGTEQDASARLRRRTGEVGSLGCTRAVRWLGNVDEASRLVYQLLHKFVRGVVDEPALRRPVDL